MLGKSYLDLIGHIEGVLISCIREDDSVQGCCGSVRRDIALEWLRKVDGRICDACMATEDDKASDRDEQKSHQLHYSDTVR